jgi:putative oxidoreductase
MFRKRLAGAIPALLVLLFVYTGADKLLHLDNFTLSMYNQPIPHSLAFFLARLIPVIEILTAGSLLFTTTQHFGLYSSFTLLSIFSVYIALILLHFFRKIPCSCAGIFRHITWQQHLWINLFLLALTGLALSTAMQKPLRSPLNHSI